MSSLEKLSLEQMCDEDPELNRFCDILYTIFSETCIVQISQVGGGWKLGKTNLGLLIYEFLKEMGVIDEGATNIYTQGENALLYVYDLVNINLWLASNRLTKLYVLDESNKHAPNRRAMTSKSVETIGLFPELSKHHARIIVIGQDFSTIDPDFSNPAYVHATFEKMSRTSVRVSSSILPIPQKFFGIPATSIDYDPDQVAPFQQKPDRIVLSSKSYEVASDWVGGKTWKELGMHTMEGNRFLKSTFKELLEENQRLRNEVVMVKGEKPSNKTKEEKRLND